MRNMKCNEGSRVGDSSAHSAAVLTRFNSALQEVKSVNIQDVRETIEGYDPDLLFVVGRSRLVTQEILDIPTMAALGMHPSPLLPGRGRAPIAWSLIKGLEGTALSFFHLVEEADAGDLVGQWPIEIDIKDDAASLYGNVVDAGRELIRTYYAEYRGTGAFRARHRTTEKQRGGRSERHDTG